VNDATIKTPSKISSPRDRTAARTGRARAPAMVSPMASGMAFHAKMSKPWESHQWVVAAGRELWAKPLTA
jgi:hypothetical protein